MNAAMQSLGAQLRQMHRNASWAYALELIEFYNVRRVELVATGDVVVRASEQGMGERVEYVVTAPGLERPIECVDRDEAIARAALLPGGAAGYRTVGSVRPLVDLGQLAAAEAQS